jgi:hypothetical protein
MKSVLPWILVAGLLAGAAALFSSNRAKEHELSALREQAAEVEHLRAELAAATGQSSQRRAELAQLRSDNEDLLRLRSDVRRQREEIQQLQVQLQEERTAKATIQEQAQAHSLQTRHIFQTGACVAILRQLLGAKQQWALDQEKTAETVPIPQDLQPYFPNQAMPTCPGGGQYSLNAVNQPPTCTMPGHAIPQ